MRYMLDIPFMNEQSVWGYDEQMQTYFAQLWRNGSTSDAPEVWLSGVNPQYRTKEMLAFALADVLKIEPKTALKFLDEEL